MNRRDFIGKTTVSGLGLVLVPSMLRAGYLSSDNGGELLYNGIRIPEIWPPRYMSPASYKPMPVPYLESPPKVIPIDVGRQLFVDDFLIEKTTLKRKFHNARKIDANPILKPETDLEKGKDGLPVACPKDGGIWWDEKDQIFKMWYDAGWIGSMAYATSKDGLHWERPDLGIEKGTNKLLPDLLPDSTTVFLDHDTDSPNERFKLFLRGPNYSGILHGYCLVSPDGIKWSEPVKTGICGDRSTIFYNPFRKKWVYSIRSIRALGRTPVGRSRFYYEHDNFLEGADWDARLVFWAGADELDKPDPAIGDKPQLYNLSAVGYESLMLGLHQIHYGPKNSECAKTGSPKTTELMVSFSRDGFHWDRPNREAFIAATRKPDDWDRGYVQSVGGICTVIGDQLRFYYIGFKGDANNLNPDDMKNGMYANGSTGVAVLRRDGFASMEAGKEVGYLTTRTVTFKGAYLFVNVDCLKGKLKVEILDEEDKPIAPYTLRDCIPVSVDKTIYQIKWKKKDDLSSLIGKKVKFRFQLENGSLYAFWVSPGQTGASMGFVAAGGPGYEKGVDTEGFKAYQKASGISGII